MQYHDHLRIYCLKFGVSKIKNKNKCQGSCDTEDWSISVIIHQCNHSSGTNQILKYIK